MNPVENIWQFLRENWLSSRVFVSYRDIVNHCCDAWNRLIDQPWLVVLHRPPGLGQCMMISAGWYYSGRRVLRNRCNVRRVDGRCLRIAPGSMPNRSSVQNRSTMQLSGSSVKLDAQHRQKRHPTRSRMRWRRAAPAQRSGSWSVPVALDRKPLPVGSLDHKVNPVTERANLGRRPVTALD